MIALPNGVDLERFKPVSADPDPRRLLFIGSFAHLPNLLAIDFFLRKVWPLIKAQEPVLHIIAGARHRFHYERFRDRVNFLLDTPRVEIEDFVSRCTTRLRTRRHRNRALAGFRRHEHQDHGSHGDGEGDCQYFERGQRIGPRTR